MSTGPIEYTNGKETVKIYPTSARGVPVYQMVYREAGRRRAFANLASGYARHGSWGGR